MSARKLRLTMAGLVLLHLVMVSLHGVAHQRMGIDLQPWQRAFVGIIIFAGPLVALAVLWMFRHELGAVLLAVSMAGSSGVRNLQPLFSFGFRQHFPSATVRVGALVHGYRSVARDHRNNLLRLVFADLEVGAIDAPARETGRKFVNCVGTRYRVIVLICWEESS
jgi:hypothetical protein